ncbi:MAG: LuxR C-terminal-related transcriptional regulator [Candidatus Devosia phytovorans]|uniref:LuxR C-terminal-related transcriptional regulator n=1 Tax=Candidatus Devosia phytovorans TaxID=3121372 RepID=A0AAJ6B3W2_9HYPH|nr:LuxR family transcriptional regulator [Devosia sp.]WEK06803.1 MAG: LuxR C-terminal-related transcriptional regulator [Devosia sp.]
MLDVVTNFISNSTRSRSRWDVERISVDLAMAHGFRSIIGFQFAPGNTSLIDYIDSDPKRREILRAPVPAFVLKKSASVISRLALRGQVAAFTVHDLGDDKTYIAAAVQTDTVCGVMVPMMANGEIIGAVKFCGEAVPASETMMDLHLVAHMLFSAMQKSRDSGSKPVLTQRESEVINLMARGLTSPEIAQSLGMSERTVNQHAENIAHKFGTKNRIHSVAEAMRFGVI